MMTSTYSFIAESSGGGQSRKRARPSTRIIGADIDCRCRSDPLIFTTVLRKSLSESRRSSTWIAGCGVLRSMSALSGGVTVDAAAAAVLDDISKPLRCGVLRGQFQPAIIATFSRGRDADSIARVMPLLTRSLA